MTDEADGDGKMSGCHSTWLLSLKQGKVRQVQGTPLAARSWSQRGESECGKEGGPRCVKTRPRPSEELHYGKEGGGPVELGDLPFPFIVKEQTRDTCTSTGHKQATHETTKVHLPGGSGAGKTRLCVYS